MRKFIVGIITGIIIMSMCMAAEQVIVKTNHKIFVNGNQVEFEAYNIDGYNYFRLKDLGKSLDFNVLWDELEQKVLIDTTKPYKEQNDIEEKDDVQQNIIKVPQSDESFCPPEGSLVETQIFKNGMFTGESSSFIVTKAKQAEPEFPKATCDWTQFPELELPEAVAKDFGNGNVGIVNLHETRRMQYTLYNLIGANELTWENGKLAKYKNGKDKAKVLLEMDDESEPQMMWPYRESELKKVFDSCPTRTWRVIAYDEYQNGRYLHTIYYLQ